MDTNAIIFVSILLLSKTIKKAFASKIMRRKEYAQLRS